MSLSDLASLGSFISGVGVLVSLIFVYFQVRQVNAQVRLAERNQQAAIQQERANKIAEISMAGAEPSIAEALAKGLVGAEDISATQLNQFRSFTHARLTLSEDAFYQHRNGSLSDEAFAAFLAKFRAAYMTPGGRILWRWNRSAYGPEFVAFVDKLAADAVLAPFPDDLERWKSEVAAEKALFSA